MTESPQRGVVALHLRIAAEREQPKRAFSRGALDAGEVPYVDSVPDCMHLVRIERNASGIDAQDGVDDSFGPREGGTSALLCEPQEQRHAQRPREWCCE